MTPEQVSAVQASLARVGEGAREVADLAGARALREHPDLGSGLRPQLATHGEVLHRELQSVVAALSDFDRLREHLSDRGVRARLRAADYRPVARALRDVLASTDPGWDEDVADAWIAACDLVTELLQAHGGGPGTVGDGPHRATRA